MMNNSSHVQFRNELDGFRSQLPVMTTLLHCSYLLGKLNDRNNSMSEGEFPVNNVAEQLNHLEKCLESRDPTLRQFKDCYSLRTESDITDAFARVAFDNVNEFWRSILMSDRRNSENIDEDLIFQDDGVAKPGEDIRALSAHWVNRSKELESQVDLESRMLLQNVSLLVWNISVISKLCWQIVGSASEDSPGAEEEGNETWTLHPRTIWKLHRVIFFCFF
jgi:hypothetical protein